MFDHCHQLKSLNLTNFDTSIVTDMTSMFACCHQLSSLNLSNFNTSSVNSMYTMFTDCFQLSSLNLSNFDTSRVRSMHSMFSGCSKLEYINLKNFSQKVLSDIEYIFAAIQDNIVLCLNENSDIIKQKIMAKNCYTFDCSDNWKINQKKKVNKPDVCYDIFNRSILYKYEYQGLYYEKCINGNLTNNSTINYCQCDNEKCSSCPNISSIYDLCIDCKKDYYEKEYDDNTYGYKKCYKNVTGYYLDINVKKFKKCYYSCEKCEMKGNNITHNCIECNNNFPIGFKIKDYLNCYHNCSHYYYLDIYNNYHCTISDKCPNEYPVQEGMECKLGNKIEKVIQNLINNEEAKKEETNYYDTILKNIEDIYTSNIYNTSFLDIGNDEIIEMEKVKVILTTSQNQKNNIDSNMTSIDLGECEDFLR